ncbi:MAG: TonB-dependent receptor, plug [Acidobacteriaceae bacterium]|nr:TonB-dependent receptor, plug [Acidobacteriaceae bacterium]
MHKKLLFLLVLLFASDLNHLIAQTYSGSIRGRVTDSTDHPVMGADVVTTSLSNNAIVRTKTGQSGDYTVPFLNEGSYRVEVSYPGFKSRQEDNIKLDLNQRLTINIELTTGQTSEVVSVEADSSQLNEISSEIGDIIDKERLTELPLMTGSNGRSPLLLAKLSPGVSSTSANNSNINAFSMGGGRPVTNEILVDGLPTTNPSDETYTLTPAPEALSQMKVITTPFSAQYGHTGGGVLLLTTNSGTSQMHGSVFDFNRNRVLNGRNYFTPAQSTIKYILNDPGGTFGAPIPLPWERHNPKTFFFGAYNLTLLSQGNTYSTVVPTAAQRAGDFSSLLNTTKVLATNPCDNTPIYQGQIFDPATVVTSGKTACRKAFPNNQIPGSRMDAVGKQMVSFFPVSNGSFANGSNYMVFPNKFRSSAQWIARIDHNFSERDKGFIRVGGFHPSNNAPINFSNAANNTTAGGWVDTQIAVTETHVFTPTLVNDFRLGFVQEHNYSNEGGGPGTSLGLTGVPLDHFPNIGVTNYVTLGASALSHDRDRSWIYSDALNWQLNAHALTIGGEYRRQLYSTYSPGKTSGGYSFGPTFSAYPGNANTGDSIADILLGLPNSTSINVANYAYKFNINSGSLYIQDDWKLRSNLTVNLGLRWEFNGTYTEQNNQFYSFNPNVIDATTGKAGATQFAGFNGAPRNFTPNIYTNFLPRVGFAWKPLDKTVVRGGYGIYRLPNIGLLGYQGLATKYGVSATFSSNDSNITPFYQLKNGVPAYSFNVDANGNANIPTSLTNPTQTVNQAELRSRSPYDQNYQIGVQQQLPGGWFAEVNYQGSKGTKLPAIYNLNQLLPSQFSVTAPQSSRPYPQYKGVRGLLNQAGSNYQSLQSKLNHRFNKGLVVEVAYTYSKFMDDVDAPARANAVSIQNVYNTAAEYGVGGYDIPQRAVGSYYWVLPIGRGGRFLNNVPVVKDILGGWSTSGIVEFQVGLPISVTQSANNLGGYTDIQRPNQISSGILPRGQRTIAKWFDTAAFVAAPATQPGNAPRFPFHGPGLINWDQAVARTFPIYERLAFQFRAEFFNSMNHTNFSAPNSQIGNKNYGVVTGAQDGRIIELVGKLQF